ncbi:MAG: tetratricopeptide repeat protein [Candidatus Eisenbacteria bacterium]|uniref:Tetratricopeptide repeat protein n=1 Tax=Eiseniibacteriota bacterium TaxID=2212470 RepID=A0A956NK63_UNCEI|nr:tetratricopeptide repeat protein [Candidatus Eisenbacteria bacterium]
MQPRRSFLGTIAIAIAVLGTLLVLLSYRVPSSFAHGTTETRLHRLSDWSSHDPYDPRPHLERAALFLETGRLDSAAVEVEWAEALHPRSAAAARVRAKIRATRGDTPGALRELDELLGRDPSDASAQRLRGELWLALGDTAAAVQDLSLALEQDPAPSPDDFLTLSALLPPEEALRVLDEGRTRLGTSIGLELRGIELSRQLEQWDDALRRVASLEHFYAKTEPLLELRAEILLAAGDFTEAAAVAIDLAERLDRQAGNGLSTPDDRARRTRATEILEACARAPGTGVDTPRSQP